MHCCILARLVTGMDIRKGLNYLQVWRSLGLGWVLIHRLAAPCLPPGDGEAQVLVCEFR